MLWFLLSIADEQEHKKIEYLFFTYHEAMIRLAKSRLKHYGDPNYSLNAEDAVQNAFVKITKYIHALDFTLSEKEIKAYVLTIVANEVNNLMHATPAFEETGDELPDEDFFARLRLTERYNEVVSAIEKLDERYSFVLLFRYREEMSVKNIARLLSIPEKSVYTRLDRGKRLLLDSLREKKSYGDE